ncbi:hypothetical protein P175DRAFT_0110514 [Aspergillus ochraceoroseus IBT 24754]|uniref:Uncharacterized protein n=1 Tax=Aspergillus ochraceoroseus IBT 24754 TaxID=1392256 RepID=A0A2T5LL82_9EURO|nr:uncharacterized protein P175DRAFT_0110514 [Aspergillus ochraceoroseus IBT 24754]PTU17044.1 hypothetical protein P175DRAFT_0110514 [Aspergillus ochraceoroseus IBT 24754]
MTACGWWTRMVVRDYQITNVFSWLLVDALVLSGFSSICFVSLSLLFLLLLFRIDVDRCYPQKESLNRRDYFLLGGKVPLHEMTVSN